MASILRQLSDADLEALHHMMRRDAHSDLEIARFAEEKLNHKGTKDTKKEVGKTDAAKIMVIHRYRVGKDFKRWLQNWENRDIELRKQLELQKQRFEVLKDLTTGQEDGFEGVSKMLQSRLLTLAAEANDEDLKEFASGKGFVANILKIVQAQAKLELSKTGEKVLAVEADKKLAPQERERRLKEIFGLA